MGYVQCSYFVLLSFYYPLVGSLCGNGHFMCLHSQMDPFVLISIITYWIRDVFSIVLNALLIDDMEVCVIYKWQIFL